MLEHHQCFPAIGDIKIDSLKVKRRGRFYHLSDSMLVKSAFATVKDNWFLSLDASRLAQGAGIQQVDTYKVGDQLALPCATDNRSVDQGSPSTHLTIVPIVNHVVSGVNQFTTGNSDKDCLKHTEEDRPFDDEINSKKRNLVQTESLAENSSGSRPSVEKKRKREEKEASVKASKDLDGENIRTNNENSMENNIQDLNDGSTRLSKGGKCAGLDQEATVVSSSIENVGAETHVQKNTEASEINMPDVFMVLEKNIEQEIPSEISQKEKEKGKSQFVQNNSEASETVPAVLMAVEENIQQEIPSEISQKEKENELVKERVMGNEIPSSSMRTSDCQLHDSEKDKTAEKDAADMSEKDLGSTVQESAGDQIDNLKEDKKSSRKQEPEVKLPRKKKRAKKSASRNKDESAKNKDELEKSKDESAKNKDEALMERADNIVSEISSVVPATAQETKNDKVSLSNAEKKKVLEKTLPDDVTMQEVEISKPTEVVEETLKEIKDSAGRRKKKKDVGRSATRNDASSMTNEENVLPHSGREESQDITLTEKNVSQGNDEGIDREPENQNENMDGEKRNKRKKKTKKSAKNGEGGMSTEVSDPHLNDHLNKNAKEHETALLDAARKDSDEVKGRDAQVSDVGLVKKAKKKKKTSVTGPEYPTSVVNDPNIPNTDQSKTPKKKSKIDAPRISKSAHANKAHGEPSAEVFLNQKSDRPRVVLGLACVRAVQKSAPEVNKSQHVKSLLSGSGTTFGGDSDKSSADDNALSGKSASLGDSASSIDSSRNGSRAAKRKGGGGNSQSKSKNISVTDRLRSSTRFKRAKVTATQQLGDTESEPVDFVPESPPMAK
ncbi:hypothetical protein CTI12_AA573520 [Artemisia annua]|uniref:Uncharacterized protein n=1 Tax=Artemisia annua TaxID=35608 RepID=A0A2U1KR77_ARTAN|nr:hypothetical protein CTI12_AA573520 [Artemisia annua]